MRSNAVEILSHLWGREVMTPCDVVSEDARCRFWSPKERSTGSGYLGTAGSVAVRESHQTDRNRFESYDPCHKAPTDCECNEGTKNSFDDSTATIESCPPGRYASRLEANLDGKQIHETMASHYNDRAWPISLRLIRIKALASHDCASKRRCCQLTSRWDRYESTRYIQSKSFLR